ncbi:efflux RND transporter periplasmic adaptor subunit [Akkermansiaceae bacterium]|jgi:RND family efflux transporter MFP subunit|nr:efflux RND transporter periplasmic adaptor subunit [Verrucomicrobiota bacterium]MDA7507745.1 efflux RND transporter periplasmic adaptor subunit [Akkermansiaceae bacterium]MBT7214418.1 efflux RND transporter periplasmic adaptor subunit [Verrucomicrobiota bacterium]MDA7616258.1 efflux RND transporter periplasmic adaptor subunit [Akkermansiaceae bacterium]MDA7655081.1 efflux RND transporter periplasmic adaptor subunit [Akkermansiaceae bacterium]
MSSQPKTSPLIVVILAILVIGSSWWGINALSKAKGKAEEDPSGSDPGGPPPANVILATVESKTSTQTHQVVGTLRAKSRAKIAAREAGATLTINFDEGDLVEINSVIATLDTRRLDAQIAEATAEITVAEALVHQKKSRVKRSAIDLAMKETAFAGNALSEAEVLDARSANNVDNSIYASAQDSLKATKSRLELLNVRLDDLKILAPFTGRVVERHIEPGEWAEPGSAIVTLVSSGEIEAWLQVPERFATTARGKQIPVTLTATGQTVTSTSLTIVPEAETSTRTLQVVALLPNPGDTLVPGLSVSAALPVSENTERLAVPVNAIVQGYAGPSIFISSTQEGSPLPVAKRLPIEILFQENETVYLKAEGLKAGDQVVVEGNERLFPFQTLLIGERK